MSFYKIRMNSLRVKPEYQKSFDTFETLEKNKPF